ncbi:hypothetical protein OV079_49390 [Nannocystis pusilla]|uniref:Uncharacterized protein n=1 Tax=Nannocystis pusilla TaxID=889268 RepID=A0A9X3F179_9BACT|nr:hypothetical protein [Nannocystis pusilla]MCY1013415.1 hypothetical protein [Nannocystis pusilla]
MRVHLAHSNIRDVVHRRLLEKTDRAERDLRALYARHRADLKLFAYDGDNIGEDDFVEVYPLLPKYIELIMQITSAMRTRSSRAQGDDQAIRGLLQLLGELFRSQGLADEPVGTLITFDQIYAVQHTALDAEIQASMARIHRECEDDTSGLQVRVAKVVALLEQIQETVPTTALLVTQCLLDRLDRGNQLGPVTEALEELRRRNLISYSEKDGYKIQSTAGEEWERDRRDLNVSAEAVSEAIQGALRHLIADPERPRLQSRAFPWKGLFSDSNRHSDVVLEDPRDEAAVVVDFRFLADDERGDTIWIPRSNETALRNRLVWVCGRRNPVNECARELGKSRLMVEKYKGRRPSLPTARRHLLDLESDRADALEKRLRGVVADAFMGGTIYFRGDARQPGALGTTFALALSAAATADLPKLFPDFIGTNVTPAELLQLIARDLAGVSTKFIGELGILHIEGGRYEASCDGTAPRLIRERIETEGGLDGASLLVRFAGPPSVTPPA